MNNLIDNGSFDLIGYNFGKVKVKKECKVICTHPYILAKPKLRRAVNLARYNNKWDVDALNEVKKSWTFFNSRLIENNQMDVPRERSLTVLGTPRNNRVQETTTTTTTTTSSSSSQPSSSVPIQVERSEEDTWAATGGATGDSGQASVNPEFRPDQNEGTYSNRFGNILERGKSLLQHLSEESLNAFSRLWTNATRNLKAGLNKSLDLFVRALLNNAKNHLKEEFAELARGGSMFTYDIYFSILLAYVGGLKVGGVAIVGLLTRYKFESKVDEVVDEMLREGREASRENNQGADSIRDILDRKSVV